MELVAKMVSQFLLQNAPCSLILMASWLGRRARARARHALAAAILKNIVNLPQNRIKGSTHLCIDRYQINDRIVLAD